MITEGTSSNCVFVMNDVEEFDEVFERNDTEGFDEVLEMNDDIFFECDDGLNVSDSETETPIHLSQKLLLYSKK